MTNTTLAKYLGWGGAFLLYAQQAITAQSVLPVGLSGWAHFLAALAFGFAVHVASNTDGVK